MRLTLQVKFAGARRLLLAFTVLVGVVSVRNLGAVHEKGGSMYVDRVVPIRDLAEVRALLGDIDSQVLRSFGTSRDR